MYIWEPLCVNQTSYISGLRHVRGGCVPDDVLRYGDALCVCETIFKVLTQFICVCVCVCVLVCGGVCVCVCVWVCGGCVSVRICEHMSACLQVHEVVEKCNPSWHNTVRIM